MIVGSLFSGLGGLDVACEWTWGASTAWQLDLTGERIRRRHWPDALQIVGDVQAVDPAALPPVDVLCGGFPCTDLSVAGNMAGLDGENSGLYREVLRFAQVLAPRFVVMENVPGLLSYMPRLCRDFRGLGYGLTWAICEAADAGYPHLRRRVFVLATRGGGDVGLVPVDQARRWTGDDRCWPTVTVNDSKNCGAPSQHERNSDALNVAVQSRGDRVLVQFPDDVDGWYVPAGHVGEAQIVGLNGDQMDVRWPSGDIEPVPVEWVQHSGRRLAPEWVEALMALPIGWTDPDGPRLTVDRNAPAVRGRYPEGWDRTRPWPGYAWEPSRTLPDGDPVPGRPARIRALGNAVVAPQAHLALSAMLAPRQGSLWGSK